MRQNNHNGGETPLISEVLGNVAIKLKTIDKQMSDGRDE
jgi:hypothetical protein